MLFEFAGGAAASAAVLAGYSRYVEPYWLGCRVRRAPAITADCSLRILQISDFHFQAGDGRRLRSIERAVELGLGLRPDLICCTGDFATSGRPFDAAALARVLRRLSGAAPAFAVLGNHDGGEWASRRTGRPAPTAPVVAMLGEAGIELLHNRSVPVAAGGRTVTVVGVGDWWANEMDGRSAFAGVSPEADTVLLSHNPDTKDLLARFPWRCMLSGHTHGGEGVLFGWAPFTPVRDRRYRLGMKPFGGRWVHVTAGVGTLSGFRFGCRPEVALVEI